MRWIRGLIASLALALLAPMVRAATITVPVVNALGQPPLSVTLTLKSPQQMQAILPRILYFSDCSSDAVARPEGTAPARASALALARTALRKPVPAAPDADRRSDTAARFWAGRILVAYGAAQDVGLATACVDAAIEARLGLLTHGQLKARVAAGGAKALDAAIQLHRIGLKEGDALLLAKAASTEPAMLFRVLDLPPAVIRPAMLAFAQRYAAQAKSGQANPLAAGRTAALLFFTATGDEKSRNALLDTPLPWYELQALAMLAADPAPLLDPVIRIAGVDSATSPQTFTAAAVSRLPGLLDSFCAVTDTLAPADAEKFWSGAAPVLNARIQAQHATNYDPSGDRPWDTNFSSNATGTIMAQAGPCRPSGWTRERYLSQDGGNWTGFLPYKPWIVRYWKADAWLHQAPTAYLPMGDAYSDQLDFIAPAAFDAVFTAPSPPPYDLLRAYHRTATAAGLHPRMSLRFLSDEDTRPYLLGLANQPSSGCGYDTVIGGVLHLLPQLAGNTLRLAIRLDQVPSYFARNMYDTADACVSGDMPVKGGKQYVSGNGAKLISGVKVWRNLAAVPVQYKPDANGAFQYEAAGGATLDGIVVEVDLALFDDRRQLFFPLYESGYAVHLRRGAHI